MSAHETPEKTETSAPRPGAVPRLRLVPVSAGGAPRFAPRRLHPGVTYIGRVAQNDVVLESDLVSRRHAKLILTDMGVTVHDLDSHNGVFLDGKKVRSAPVTPGQLVYFADVCCTLERAGDEDGDFDVDSSLNRSNLVTAALGAQDEDAPAVHNLATLYRCTDLLLQADDDNFFVEVVSACQALTEASLAVLVLQGEGGALSTPVALREGTGHKDEAPVSWPVVRRAIDERVALFSRDAETDPLVHGVLGSDERGAIMCVPIVSEERAHGALYFTRPSAGQGFTDRELETLSAVAHLVAARLAGGHPQPGAAPDPAERAARERAEVELADLKEQLVALTRDLEAARAEAAARDAEAGRAAQAQAGNQAELDALRQELEQARAALAALERERASSAEAEEAARQATDAAAREREALAQERDVARSERDAAARERDALAQERDAARSERDALAQERDAAARERDALAQDRDALAQDRDALAQERDAAARALEEVQSALEAAQIERNASRARVEQLEGEAAAAAARTTELEAALEAQRGRAEAQAAQAAAVEALTQALERALPRRVAARVQALAAGEASGEVSAGPSTLLCVALSGLDAWAQTAAPQDLKARLDWFCVRARELAGPLGGEVEQSLGHTLLVRFPSGADGVQGAVRCALEVVKEALATGASAQAGVHLGANVSGVFGDGILAHVGEAAAVARGATEFAQPGTVYVSEAVRAALGAESGLLLVALGPHIIRGLPNPVNLYQLVSQDGGAA